MKYHMPGPSSPVDITVELTTKWTWNCLHDVDLYISKLPNKFAYFRNSYYRSSLKELVFVNANIVAFTLPRRVCPP
jgi:hypothetical protein